jgi:hypothetical protein
MAFNAPAQKTGTEEENEHENTQQINDRCGGHGYYCCDWNDSHTGPKAYIFRDRASGLLISVVLRTGNATTGAIMITTGHAFTHGNITEVPMRTNVGGATATGTNDMLRQQVEQRANALPFF